ncbi:elongation factor P 5-aminopentanone reductase [Halalkalibacter krulwichiae]|uniref:3-oxoacyl-[acyl-carrier-protein] reductase FabG n=1 Tax=Halalkalibacter krulwichiae TaxID=199441 RepID=A0A1X9MK01_9BACI|nr:SDR family NAD(P)-dependent oxidoreductase [Halalkalibacter krulwichiae]ARK30942.1 3-oxoacyl-[acyl-carrier-protein] reductase FabG [Halalkalibacter krulwichiae]
MESILITGASGGIGSAIARELASPTCSLFLHYSQNKQAAQSVANECREMGATVTLIEADLTKDNGESQLLKQLPTGVAFQSIIHNAGISHFGLFTDVTNEQINEMMNIHLINPMKITRSLLPAMLKKKKGKIVLISSIWGLTGASCEVMYSAAKGGVNSFIKGLAKEVAPSQIQVNGIAPGAIDTNMLVHDDVDELKEEIPANQIGTPIDIAHAVSFLVSDRSNYINGQVLSVNGAWYC